MYGVVMSSKYSSRNSLNPNHDDLVQLVVDQNSERGGAFIFIRLRKELTKQQERLSSGRSKIARREKGVHLDRRPFVGLLFINGGNWVVTVICGGEGDRLFFLF